MRHTHLILLHWFEYLELPFTTIRQSKLMWYAVVEFLLLLCFKVCLVKVNTLTCKWFSPQIYSLAYANIIRIYAGLWRLEMIICTREFRWNIFWPTILWHFLLAIGSLQRPRLNKFCRLDGVTVCFIPLLC